MTKLISEDASWDFKDIQWLAEEVEIIGREEMGMDPFPWQIEIVSSDNMIDIYSTSWPISYPHWSYGKKYLQSYLPYKAGKSGLAYEVVLPGCPSLISLHEDNTFALMAITIPHAGVGHSHIFKNNYLFSGTSVDTGSITDYLDFAKTYILQCEDKYGVGRVERILDACHALQYSSMTLPHNKKLSLANEQKRFNDRQRYAEAEYNEIWNSVPTQQKPAAAEPERVSPGLPESNLLYFIEKHSPILLPWQREIVRIVRKLAQYRYPSVQCSVVHESAAVYSHNFCTRRLHEKGLISDGAMLEVIASTANVTYQGAYDRWSGFNIYTVGINIADDIVRMCTSPTAEDIKWFPDIAGNQKPMETLRYAWENFRDESFIKQFLSPKVMRDMKMFRLEDDHNQDYYEVVAIHDDEGYKAIRTSLGNEYLPERVLPDIRVTGAQMHGNRILELTHYTDPGMPLAQADKIKTMSYIHDLWGHRVSMVEMTRDGKYSVKAGSYIG